MDRNDEKDDGIEGSLYVLRDGEFEHVPVRGSLEKVAEGILYAAEHGTDIMNMRLGPEDGEGSKILDEAIEYAASKGAIVVVGAGDSKDGRASPERAERIDDALTRMASMARSDKPKMTLTDIVLHAGAVVASTMAGLTGDYASLGGYQGIYSRLEMGLAQLKAKSSSEESNPLNEPRGGGYGEGRPK